MERVLILGGGRHAAVVVDILRAAGRQVIAGLVDDATEGAVEGVPILGRLTDLAAIAAASKATHAIAAVGLNHVRRRIALAAETLLPGLQWASAIHPSAVVSHAATVGAGSVVVASATINVGARIGRHALVNTRASVDHDCVLGDFASIAPGVTLGGNVSVGSLAAVGIGATVTHGVTIGEASVIGAHALVLADCAPLSVYYGVPARRIRARLPDDPYL